VRQPTVHGLYFTTLHRHSIAYFTEKKNGKQLAKKKISGFLVEKLRITTINEELTQKAVTNPALTIWRTGLQYYSALDSDCTCIVSYDRNDFHFSELEVLDAEAFLLKHVVAAKGN
jgi:hypothetical protein